MSARGKDSNLSFDKRFTTMYTDGSVITQTGTGGGVAFWPEAIREYGAALGLKPLEAWLLITLMSFVWERGNRARPSFLKLARDWSMGEKTLTKARDNLIRMGYIRFEGQGTAWNDRTIRYSIDGFNAALTYAILCDPEKTDNPVTMADLLPNSPREFSRYTTPDEVNKYYNDHNQLFDWNTRIPEPIGTLPSAKKTGYSKTCQDCSIEFIAGAKNAVRCPSCRKKLAKQKLASLLLRDVPVYHTDTVDGYVMDSVDGGERNDT